MPEPVITVFENPGYCPWDSPRIAARLRELGARPVMVRVASWSVQVQSPPDVAGRVVEAGRRVLGRLLYGPREPPEPRSMLEVPFMVSRLVAEERFWEAHEVAETAWRDGLTSIWPLAVATGALAKAQEGNLEAALGLAWRAMYMLGLRVPGAGNIDWGRLSQAVVAVATCKPTGLEGLFTGPIAWYSHDRPKPV